MYFVDQRKIEETLLYMEKVWREMNQVRLQTFSERLSYERMVHVSIESILDVGNMMIDGFIMRDPGSYNDIIDILVDESVLPKEDEQHYKEFIALRKEIVNEYTAVNHERIKQVVEECNPVLQAFGTHVRTYLKNELGVANAFTNPN
ncbi:DUF86 domain-containing protein [Oceanobacillus piezotolerans]|uniref:DUF86 domain-containing protein n=1 Tax=Oceanobacillus piezotolerans TaxID=2448030 RepID=A0A498DF05_9BACI|nr:DUF86 domain-containing protein [Oceanobacillus piezotolerans]RLL46501.1 DUF86 domain-containing protein [Oceanobacillus piezotolerans]